MQNEPNAAQHAGQPSEPPLVVDIDGSLVSGDLLVEGAARLPAAAPFSIFGLLPHLLRGRAALKRRVAEAVPLPAETLALHPAVLDEIAAAKAAGREVWLATASDELAAAPLVEAVGAAGCFASNGRVNLAGEAKADVLAARFGEGGFDYIGNERRDLAVWKRARHAVGVGLSAGLARKVRELDSGARFLPRLGGRPRDYLRALRPHQWVKNVLAFAPPIAAHETGIGPYLAAAGAALALTALASAAYLLNDLLDLPHDRRHGSKRFRPLAAGKIPLLPAGGIGAALTVGGLALAFSLSAEAGLYAILYLTGTLSYSLFLKRKTFIDVVTLAGLYAARILAGAAAAAVALSPWFLAFALFLFLALAVVKRQSELHALRESGGSAAGGRPYFAEDFPVITALGAASSFAAVVILTLYIQSPEVGGLYARPEFLWLLCPLLLYWLGRMALLANRGAVAEDPLVFAAADRASWLVYICILAVLAAAL